jgi:hypothetical protein
MAMDTRQWALSPVNEKLSRKPIATKMRLPGYECMGTEMCELDNNDADLLSHPHICNNNPKITDVIMSHWTCREDILMLPTSSE